MKILLIMRVRGADFEQVIYKFLILNTFCPNDIEYVAQFLFSHVLAHSREKAMEFVHTDCAILRYGRLGLGATNVTGIGYTVLPSLCRLPVNTANKCFDQCYGENSGRPESF